MPVPLKSIPRSWADDVAVQGSDLATNLRTGYIPLPLTAWRLIAANAVPNLAAIGGIMASDSAPALQRVNGATDKCLRIAWAASGVVEITTEFPYPADLDNTRPITVKLRAKSAGATDIPVLAVGYFEGVGDTNAGGNTGATSNVMQTLSVIIAATDVGPYPNTAVVSLVPAAHTTDALELYEVWVEYTRR